jgi:uncharacterized protein (DUF58 family)
MSSPGGTSTWRRLLLRAERRLPSLTRLRAAEALPIELHRRRIYIVPTAFGMGFSVLLLVMLLGALNYSNNAALLLTCMLGAAAAGSMLVAFRAMDGMRMTAIRADSTTAGQPVVLRIDIAAGTRERQGIVLAIDDVASAFHIAADSSATVTATLPTELRGWLPLPRMKVSTTWPLGMFRAWSWLHPDRAVLVYPRPEAHGPPPREPDADADRGRPRPGDELAQLRVYRPGDPQRQIAWKLSARHDDLLVKDLEQPAPQEEWRLSWHAIHGLDSETRIARLARWVTQAHHDGRRWSLDMPDRLFDLAEGDEHFHRCMIALALQP